MPEFLELIPPEHALRTFFKQLSPQVIPETVSTETALHRVTAEDIRAPHPMPEFRRSTVDGYAVQARDTHGASEALPAYLDCVGEVPMGEKALFEVQGTECALIHTGGMIPPGADAVVMVEETQTTEGDEVEILKAVGVGENVIQVGEDVAEGERVIPQGTAIRPAEIGGLMGLGLMEFQAARKPRVGILSSGDEVIPPDERPGPGEVRDINTYTLQALVEKAGGEPVLYGIIPDNRRDMLAVLATAREECQLVIVTAGSSASARDLTSRVMEELGEPGVLVHGVNVKPGKPTILAVAEETALIGLPGNPVSALVIARLFVVPVIEAFLGLDHPRPRPSVPAVLQINVSSAAGREDWVPVRVSMGPDEVLLAEPLFGKSNLIFNLARADGLFRVPADANGISAGEMVFVQLM